MAPQTSITQEMPVLVRMARPERDLLWQLIFKRYPEEEWGTFLRLGWKETPAGLVVTVNGIDQPLPGDLDEVSEIVEIQSQYTRRILRLTEEHNFAVGIVHSHPENYGTSPSPSDYEMEAYYSDLLKGYTDTNPFVSLIFSKSGHLFSGSGRVWWRGRWHKVSRFAIEGQSVSIYNFEQPKNLNEEALERVARLASVFSVESAEALAGSKVGIVGLSGTGSPIVELLARAGVGNLVLIDPDVFSDSNLERLHGSEAKDIGTNIPKSLLAKRHAQAINPRCNITAIQGWLPQAEVLDSLLWCDLVFGCTDLYSARVALSDLSLRFNIPVIDLGVSMEGNSGKVTGQTLQINRLFPGDACVYCRGMIDSRIASQELLPEEERMNRQAEARNAALEDRVPNAYWIETPQLNTVGYLTTLAASMATGFGVGYLTGRFGMANNRIELSFNRKGISVVEQNACPGTECNCPTMRGIANQDPFLIFSSPAPHWSDPIFH